MKERIGLTIDMDPFVGKYFSTEYIRRQVLMQTETEYKEMDRQMKKDIKSGVAISAADSMSLDTMSRQNDAFAPEIQDAQAQDDAARSLELEKEKAKLTPKPSPNKGSAK